MERDHSRNEERVLRTFVSGGRLVAMPTAHAKRLVVLDRIVQDFEPGERFTEDAVNTRLRRWHDDVAMLRRWLVDVGFLDRDHGVYWRSGGTVPTDADETAGVDTSGRLGSPRDR
ncbi:MAG: DUF2087 domain-containing protein [Actinobacteria bacterium]|nr:DUF2087 domain-containing protein [Actinomycetota bacterium]